jgi:hypothetical protein
MRICTITSTATLYVSNICDPLLSRNVAYPSNVLRARHHLAHSDYASKRPPIDSTALRITRTCLTIVQDLWHCSLFSDRGIIPQYAPRYACRKTNFWENKQPHHYPPYRTVRITHHACGTHLLNICHRRSRLRHQCPPRLQHPRPRPPSPRYQWAHPWPRGCEICLLSGLELVLARFVESQSRKGV